jgi:hypothetical protein
VWRGLYKKNEMRLVSAVRIPSRPADVFAHVIGENVYVSKHLQEAVRKLGITDPIELAASQDVVAYIPCGSPEKWQAVRSALLAELVF